MVALSAAPQSGALIGVAARTAAALGLPWLAVSVEPASRERTPEESRRVIEALLMAEQLGAETLVVRGDDVPEALLAAARARGVTRMIVGRPTRASLRDRLRGSLLDRLLREASGIEVLVTSAGEPPPSPPPPPRPRATWREYATACLGVGLAPLLGVALGPLLEVADHALLHLLAVILVASRVSRGPAVFAVLLAVLSFDVAFVPPYGTLRVAEPRFLVTFLVMFLVGFVVSSLTVRVREQAEAARRRERRTQALYAMTRALAEGGERATLARAAAEHTATLVSGRATLRLEGLEPFVATSSPPPEGAPALQLPLRGRERGFGDLEVEPAGPLDPEQRQLLELFAAAIGSALERERSREEAERAARAVEVERARNGLLSAISHDLRTPLASVVGGLSVVLGGEIAGRDRATLETARDEAERLGRLLQGLLDLTRLSAGGLQPRLEWWPASELVSGARARVQGMLSGRALRVEIEPPDLEIHADGLLLGELLENLLENAARYAPPGTTVDLTVRRAGEEVRLSVRDRGPGVPEAERARIFERFYRVEDGGRHPGAGLGLAICAAVARVHGGRISVHAPEDGPGARFVVELPSAGAPPRVLEDE